MTCWDNILQTFKEIQIVRDISKQLLEFAYVVNQFAIIIWLYFLFWQERIAS